MRDERAVNVPPPGLNQGLSERHVAILDWFVGREGRDTEHTGSVLLFWFR
jgi:hypothetical protein